MIRLPIASLRLILVCLNARRKAIAFNANMFKHAGIGHKETAVEHDRLVQLEGMIAGLCFQGRDAKTKTFTIALDSVIKS